MSAEENVTANTSKKKCISKITNWMKSEKGMIIWTSGIGVIVGAIYAHNGAADFPSVNWLGRMASGMATLAILSSIVNRYAIAVGREKSGEVTKRILDWLPEVNKSQKVSMNWLLPVKQY